MKTTNFFLYSKPFNNLLGAVEVHNVSHWSPLLTQIMVSLSGSLSLWLYKITFYPLLLILLSLYMYYAFKIVVTITPSVNLSKSGSPV